MDAAIAQQIAQYLNLVEGVTVPAKNGARRIPDIAGAVALSEATANLHSALAAEIMAMIAAEPAKLPAGMRVVARSSRSGRTKTLAPEKVRIMGAAIGVGGIDPIALAALQRAVDATAFPVAIWNKRQRVRPGGPHQRYRVGDIVSAEQFEILRSAARLAQIPQTHRAADDTSADGAGTTQRSVITNGGLIVDSEAFTASFGSKICRFGKRQSILHRLLCQLNETPGRFISRDRLCGPKGAWSDRAVEDATIRGAATRLKRQLRQAGLELVAAGIEVATQDGKLRVRLNFPQAANS